MKIVVMSDTHLERVTDDFRAICNRYCNEADMVIHLGDLTGDCILDYLEAYPLQAVAGNTDGPTISSRLPIQRVVEAGEYRIGITHGYGLTNSYEEHLRNQFSDVDAILFGHTHKPLQVERNGVLWFNPGSVFLGRGSAPGTLGILHVNGCIRSEIITLRR